MRECLRRPPENFGFPIYFEGAVDVADGVVVTAFLCFFTFLVPVVAVLVLDAEFAAGAAGAAGV